MRVGIMQPYFVPYIGYWQLMNAVDKYVVFDDVNYIKRGWVNRNRILLDCEPHYLTVPVSGASQNKKILEIEISWDEKARIKNLRTLEYAYKKAPHYAEAFPLVEQMFSCQEKNLVAFILNSFRIVRDYLGIRSELILSSEIPHDNTLKAQEKIISICKKLGTTEYYNAIGGQSLYSFEMFRQNGMELCFLRTDEILYKQYNQPFQANLSIIDVMMFCSTEEIHRMLNRYTLIRGG